MLENLRLSFAEATFQRDQLARNWASGPLNSCSDVKCPCSVNLRIKFCCCPLSCGWAGYSSAQQILCMTRRRKRGGSTYWPHHTWQIFKKNIDRRCWFCFTEILFGKSRIEARLRGMAVSLFTTRVKPRFEKTQDKAICQEAKGTWRGVPHPSVSAIGA